MIKDEEEDKNLAKFKQLCQAKLKKQPGMHILGFVRGGTACIDVDVLSNEDMEFIEILFCLAFSIIRLEGSYEKQVDKRTPSSNVKPKGNLSDASLKNIFRLASKNLEMSNRIKLFAIEHLAVTERQMLEMRQGIENNRTLKQFSIKHCGISQSHIQPLTRSFCNNRSLLTLNFSHNRIREVGECIGKVLSEHSQRRNQKKWFYGLRGQLPEEDISTEGLCEVNLEWNEVSNHAVSQWMKFLNHDSWTRSINLRHNKIEKQGIKEFVTMMRKNDSLISLDLRDNPGFDQESSRFIFKKLVRNIHKFKEYKENYGKNRHEQSRVSHTRSASKSSNKQHASYATDKKENAGQRGKTNPNATAHFSLPKGELQASCENCKRNHIRLLQVEKSKLDLAIENRRLRMLLLPKECSSIGPPMQQLPQIPQQLEELSVNLRNLLANDPSEDVLSRIEYIVMQLTKILEIGEGQHQNTQTLLSNPLSISHTHNMSNTVQILAPGGETRSLLEHQDISGIQ